MDNIDIIATMDETAKFLKSEALKSEMTVDHIRADSIDEARAAVADLIEAADEVLYELRDKSEAKAALIAAIAKARGQ